MARTVFEPLEEGNVVHHAGRMRWTEESFLDIPKQEEENSSTFLGVFHRRKRMTIFFSCIGIVSVLFLWRLITLQIFSGKNYATIAERNRVRVVPERAHRGRILDIKGRPIVVNKPEFILTVTPAELPKAEDEKRAVFTRLARILGESPLTITEEVSGLPRDPLLRNSALPFRESIDFTVAQQLLVMEERLPAFRIETREQRSYPETYVNAEGTYEMPKSLAHVVGYLGKISTEEIAARQKQGYLASDLVGKDGIERFYETDLHGKHGKRFVEINALGQAIGIIGEDPQETGKELTIAIDLDVQRALELALERTIAALPKRERKGAMGVAIDPRDGSLRALVSLPAYDPRILSGKGIAEEITKLFQDTSQPLFFRPIQGEYPSGSTIKPLIALAALEEKLITPGTTILSSGGIAVGPWFFPDWKAGGHGLTDVRKAIAESVNTFFYTIGGGYGTIQGLGVDRIEQWMRRFRFGTALGIDLPHEATGLVPTPAWKKEKRNEIWYIGDTYHLAIGQGDILVTPLQIAMMTSVFANGGTLWQPKILTTRASYMLAERIASSEAIRVIREGMRRTVTGGSAQFLQSLPIAVAGKTGTAEWSSKRPPHAWFTGFAPYNEPELVVTILVEEGGEGSATAVPVAYEVFREYFSKNRRP